MRAHRAFSLVELLTALVLLAVGLAAFVRAAGAIARLESDARLRRVVAQAVRARLDSLAGQPCGAARSGTAEREGVHERWTASPDDGRLQLADSVTVPARPALARVLAVRLACRP